VPLVAQLKEDLVPDVRPAVQAVTVREFLVRDHAVACCCEDLHAVESGVVGLSLALEKSLKPTATCALSSGRRTLWLAKRR
jgi:hypothetical protein